MRHLRNLRLLSLSVLATLALTITPSANAATTLYATAGPTHSITLTTRYGTRVRSVIAGRAYIIVARDRSTTHNIHLRGAGVSRATSVERVGTSTWAVTFRVGTYTYLCDAHPQSMIGTFVSR